MTNNHDLWLVHCQLVILGASAVTAFYLYYATIIKAAPSITVTSQWTDDQTQAILQYFTANKSKIGDAGNFKKPSYIAAAEAIQDQIKTWEQVKTKWQSVSHTFELIIDTVAQKTVHIFGTFAMKMKLQAQF